MSILANGLVDYSIPNYRDVAAVTESLAATVPVLEQVQDYWCSVNHESREAYSTWTCIHHRSGPDEFFAYFGPGGFSLQFGPRVARIGAACRFSGFATIYALHAVHLSAFRKLAEALGGTRLVLMPEENGPISDAAMYEGASLNECLKLIQETWGDPHPRTEPVTEDIEIYYRRKFPPWYLETLPL